MPTNAFTLLLIVIFTFVAFSRAAGDAVPRPEEGGIISIDPSPKDCPSLDCAREIQYQIHDYQDLVRFQACVGPCEIPSDEIFFGEEDCIARRSREGILDYRLERDPFSLVIYNRRNESIMRLTSTSFAGNNVPETAPERAYIRVTFEVPDATRCSFFNQNIRINQTRSYYVSPSRMISFESPLIPVALFCPQQNVVLVFPHQIALRLRRITFSRFQVEAPSQFLDMLIVPSLAVLPQVLQCRDTSVGALRPPFNLSAMGVVVDAGSPYHNPTVKGYYAALLGYGYPVDVFLFDQVARQGGAYPWGELLNDGADLKWLKERTIGVGTAIGIPVYPVIPKDVSLLYDPGEEGDLLQPMHSMKADDASAYFPMVFQSWQQIPGSQRVYNRTLLVRVLDFLPRNSGAITRVQRYMRHFLDQGVDSFYLATSTLQLHCAGILCGDAQSRQWGENRETSCTGTPPDTMPDSSLAYQPCFGFEHATPLPFNLPVSDEQFHTVFPRFHNNFVTAARIAAGSRPLFTDALSPVTSSKAVLIFRNYADIFRTLGTMSQIGAVIAPCIICGPRGLDAANLRRFREQPFAPTVYLGQLATVSGLSAESVRQVRTNIELHYWLLPTLIAAFYENTSVIPYQMHFLEDVDPTADTDAALELFRGVFVATSVPFELPPGIWYLHGSADRVLSGRVTDVEVNGAVLPFFVNGGVALVVPAHTVFAPDIARGPIDLTDWSFPLAGSPASARSTRGAARIDGFSSAQDAMRELHVRLFAANARTTIRQSTIGLMFQCIMERQSTNITFDISVQRLNSSLDLTDIDFTGIDLVVHSSFLPGDNFTVTGPAIAWQRQENGTVFALPFQSQFIVISSAPPANPFPFPYGYTALFSILIVALASAIALLLFAARTASDYKNMAPAALQFDSDTALDDTDI